jgi:hypothetical protein
VIQLIFLRLGLLEYLQPFGKNILLMVTHGYICLYVEQVEQQVPQEQQVQLVQEHGILKQQV